MALAAILTLAGKFGFTVIVIVFDVVGELVKHGVAFEVITTLTVFPLANVFDVYVALFVPTLLPFTFHCLTGKVPPLTGVAVNVTDVPEHIVVAPADIPHQRRLHRLGCTMPWQLDRRRERRWLGWQPFHGRQGGGTLYPGAGGQERPVGPDPGRNHLFHPQHRRDRGTAGCSLRLSTGRRPAAVALVVRDPLCSG